MAPKIKLFGAKTDAELALEKRYELLRKKKEEKAAKKAAADAGLTKPSEDAAEVPAHKEPVGTAAAPSMPAATLSAQREQTNAPTPAPSKTVPKKDHRSTGASPVVTTFQTPAARSVGAPFRRAAAAQRPTAAPPLAQGLCQPSSAPK